MIKRIPVYQGALSVSSFKVESFPANSLSSLKEFDLLKHGIVRVVAEAGNKALDSDISPDSIWFDVDTVFIKFGDLMLPKGGQNVLTLLVYKLNEDAPILVSSAYTYTQIVLVTI